MGLIGFSTGALAYSDFQLGVLLLRQTSATAVELSALRQQELASLVSALHELHLDRFQHISVHLPSSVDTDFERVMLELIEKIPVQWPLITHPNIIRSWQAWRDLGPRLCIENMDKRKAIGQTRTDLAGIFERVPDATFCLDLGHAHQIDPTMGEAVLIIEQFRDKLRQLHVSEVNSESRHDPISLESAYAFSMVAPLIPPETPIILESRLSPTTPESIEEEIEFTREVLQYAVGTEGTRSHKAKQFASAAYLELAGD